MIFPRTKLVERFKEFSGQSGAQYIAVVGSSGIGKTTFLDLIRENSLFADETITNISISEESPLSSFSLDPDSTLVIIDSSLPVSFSDIRTFIESNSFVLKVVFTSESVIMENGVENFTLPGISFREYSEGVGKIVDIGAVMSGKVDIHEYNALRDTYIHLGQFPTNINTPEHVNEGFNDILSIMNQELFKKEEGDFLEFIRNVAMNVGDIFKEERIAKNMNISRRKVRKYTEIILKHNLIKAIGPWVENTTVELSRHVKVYFSDLSYFHAALGVTYYHGENKQGVIENFILLELERKLASTHDIRFYRKKSGAEVSFILTEKETNKITPIVVTIRSSDIIPQALKSFYETYGDRIDHSMIMNDTIATQKSINNGPVIILPHIAI